MSTDGPALFADDTAHDVRGEFTELLAESRDADRSTDELVSRWAEFLEVTDQAPVFWLALAAVQWRFGCLRDDIRDRAIKVIDDGSDLRRWEGLPAYRQRAAVLRRLRAQLLGPQRPAKLPARKRRRELPTVDLASPDGSRLAKALQFGSARGHPLCTNVLIYAGPVGVSAFQVQCALREIAMKWRGDSELEISYPMHAHVDQRHREVSDGGVRTQLVYERRA